MKTKELLDTFKEYITEKYGDRCPDTSSGCHTCSSWALFDLIKTFFYDDEEWEGENNGSSN